MTTPHPLLDELLTNDVVQIRPWPDDVIELLGFDPRSGYCEQFWLPLIGPSTLWLLRRIAAGLDVSPEGFPLPIPVMAAYLGLGPASSKNSPMKRSIVRSVDFGLARLGDGLEVRRKLPPLAARQIVRLHPSLQSALSRFEPRQTSA